MALNNTTDQGFTNKHFCLLLFRDDKHILKQRGVTKSATCRLIHLFAFWQVVARSWEFLFAMCTKVYKEQSTDYFKRLLLWSHHKFTDFSLRADTFEGFGQEVVVVLIHKICFELLLQLCEWADTITIIVIIIFLLLLWTTTTTILLLIIIITIKCRLFTVVLQYTQGQGQRLRTKKHNINDIKEHHRKQKINTIK